MLYKNRRNAYNNFILIFVVIKVGLNCLAISHFGFHRDELLHLALGDHLDWGFKEVPPVIAVLGRISTIIFGDSVAACRIFSTIAAGLLVWLVGLITVELGGKMFAITLSCLSFIFAPAFVASDYLFQPVVFDQLWWVLCVWLIARYINYHSVKYIYFLGLVIGIGLLTKYTMGFFAIALFASLVFTKQRKLLWNKHILGATAIALIMFLPNIIWQFQHHLPVITHMKTLQKNQLNYIKPSDFISEQLLVNGVALFVWLVGFGFLLFSSKLRKFQFMAFAFVLIFIFLVEMSGKDYYLFGAYPMLFAAGGYGFERWIKIKYTPLRALAVMLFTIPNLVLFPLVLPVFPLNTTLNVFQAIDRHFPFFRFAATWEDHKLHPLTQDYADMLGWDEIGKKVADTYNSLTPEQKKHTIIYADNYGLAGAIHHFGKQYNLPDVYSLDSSFTLWTPEVINADYIVYVDDDDNVPRRIAPMIASYKKTGEIENTYAREKGSSVYLLTKPSPAFSKLFEDERAKKLLK